MVVTIDGGQRNNNTMISAAGDLLPYSVSDPSFGTVNNRGPGNGNYKVVTFTGTVQATAYQSAVAGTYSDQLIVQVTP